MVMGIETVFPDFPSIDQKRKMLNVQNINYNKLPLKFGYVIVVFLPYHWHQNAAFIVTLFMPSQEKSNIWFDAPLASNIFSTVLLYSYDIHRTPNMIQCHSIVSVFRPFPPSRTSFPSLYLDLLPRPLRNLRLSQKLHNISLMRMGIALKRLQPTQPIIPQPVLW